MSAVRERMRWRWVSWVWVGMLICARLVAAEPPAPGEVVIAKSSSAHRDALAERLRAELTATGIVCRVVSLAELSGVDAGACRNIVVLTDVTEWSRGKILSQGKTEP